MNFLYLMIFTFVLTSSIDASPTLPQHAATSHHNASQYLRSAGQYALIFTGREHEKYPLYYINHPWYISAEYHRGTVFANKISFPDVQMRLDLYRNELVISPDNSPFNIVADADSAIVHGKKIIRISPQINPSVWGYVVVVHEGKNNRVYLKNNLMLRQKVVSGVLTQQFETTRVFWLHYRDDLHRLSKISDLYPFYPDQRPAIRSFINDNNLNFRKNPEQTLVLLMDYLEKL